MISQKSSNDHTCTNGVASPSLADTMRRLHQVLWTFKFILRRIVTSFGSVIIHYYLYAMTHHQKFLLFKGANLRKNSLRSLLSFPRRLGFFYHCSQLPATPCPTNSMQSGHDDTNKVLHGSSGSILWEAHVCCAYLSHLHENTSYMNF